MADQVIRIAVDPGPAEAGARRVVRSLAEIAREGRDAATAISEVESAIEGLRSAALLLDRARTSVLPASARVGGARRAAGGAGQLAASHKAEVVVPIGTNGMASGTAKIQLAAAAAVPLGRTLLEIAVRVVLGKALEELIERVLVGDRPNKGAEKGSADIDLNASDERLRTLRGRLVQVEETIDQFERLQRGEVRGNNFKPAQGVFEDRRKVAADLRREIEALEEMFRSNRERAFSGPPVPQLSPLDTAVVLLRELLEVERGVLGAIERLRAEVLGLIREFSGGEASAVESVQRDSTKENLVAACPDEAIPGPSSLDSCIAAQGQPNLNQVIEGGGTIGSGFGDGAVQAQRELQRAIDESEVATRDFADTSLGAFQEYADAASDAAAQAETLVTKGFQGMEEALVSFVQTGKVDFKSLVDSMVADLLRLTIRSQILGPLAQAFGSALGSSSPFAGGSGPAPGSFRAAQTEGFAHGGSFIVPGSGGIDSVVPIFRATPGERVTVTPPGRGTSGSVVNVNVINEAGARVDVQERDNGQGGIDIEVLIARAVERDIAGGGRVARAIAQNFGARPAAIGR